MGIHSPVHSRWKLRHRLQPTLKATATNQDSRTKSWLPSKGQRAGNSDPLIQEPVLPLALLNSLSSQFEAASCSSLHHHPIARSTEGGRKQPVSRTAPQSNTGQIETTQMCGPEDTGGGGEGGGGNTHSPQVLGPHAAAQAHGSLCVRVEPCLHQSCMARAERL